MQQTSAAGEGIQQSDAAREGAQQADAAKQAEGRQMPAATQGSLGEILGKEGAASLEQQLKALETDGKQVLFVKMEI